LELYSYPLYLEVVAKLTPITHPPAQGHWVILEVGAILLLPPIPGSRSHGHAITHSLAQDNWVILRLEPYS
jgi:hypothetical protein